MLSRDEKGYSPGPSLSAKEDLVRMLYTESNRRRGPNHVTLKNLLFEILYVAMG